MTISVAPAASGVKTLWLSTLTTTTKVRKNAPIPSTVYLRISVAHSGVAASATDSCWLVMTSAIWFPPLELSGTTLRLLLCGPAVILASGYLSPRLTELVEFLLAAIMLATRFSVYTRWSAEEERKV